LESSKRSTPLEVAVPEDGHAPDAVALSGSSMREWMVGLLVNAVVRPVRIRMCTAKWRK
jgi:hypothetical protein